MKLVDLKCKNCGSKLTFDTSENKYICDHCKSEFIIDEETKKIKLVDMEENGYEFEKGRIRAQKEEKKSKLLGYSNDRSLLVNIIVAICCFLGMFLIPSIIAIILLKYVNETIGSIIGDVVFILILLLVFYKDLIKEFKYYFGDFKNNFKKSFKIYILGFIGMIVCNLFILTFLKDMSSNENQVREMLYKNAIPTLISISIIAPILEELIFRRSIAPIFKKRWVYVIISGLLFGCAHIIVNFVQGTFIITDLFYILPYACLGGAFALMDYNNKSVFPSIIIHAFHNTCTAIILLITYLGGK